MTKPDMPPAGHISFEYPDDERLLAAIGKVTLHATHLDVVLKYTIKSITGASIKDVLQDTFRTQARDLRKRVRRLARKKLQDGPALIELGAILSRAEEVADERNRIVHSNWVRDENGNYVIQDPFRGHIPIPTVEELETLADKIKNVYGELNQSRHVGSLRKALDEVAD